MGLAIEGDNIGVYKACIKDANNLKDLTLPPLFGESNKLDLGPVPSFLPILTAVEELLIARVYIYLQVIPYAVDIGAITNRPIRTRAFNQGLGKRNFKIWL
jgi:hypothetical protein